MDRPLTIAIVGAGQRGKTYSAYAHEHPDELRVVAVAEPRAYHRDVMRARFSIPDDNVFHSWEDLAARGRIADAVVIATQDSMHVHPAIAFANLKYHILLEKPMAVTAADCAAIVAAVRANDVKLAVCHVLRYTPYQQKIQEIIRSGVLGDVVDIQHIEGVGNFHFAHSYVRGNWRKESESSSALLAKCCHDIDLLSYMLGRKCEKVSSFGSLKIFRPENKPAGAASRCVECPLQDQCCYSAVRQYGRAAERGDFGWPVSVVADEPTRAAVYDALRLGPYGRCVWECDNDVVDHQLVNMQFEGGATASLTMAAFTKDVCVRKTRVFGSLGELQGDGLNNITVHNFVTDATQTFTVADAPDGSSMRGHGGADYFLMRAFVTAVRTNNSALLLSGPEETLESHLMVFAAEMARKESRVVFMSELNDVLTGVSAPVAADAEMPSA